MELVEIRDLDGPNVFLLGPAIKLEVRLSVGAPDPNLLPRLRARLDRLGSDDEADPEDDPAAGPPADDLTAVGDLLVELVLALHLRAGAPRPEVRWAELETPGHLAVAFGWERRTFALALAGAVAAIAANGGGDPAEAEARLRDLQTRPPAPDDAPQLVRDADRTVPIVGVTGTNGKTTTTRLIAHVLRGAGRKVGWSSTAGVFIEGELVLEGDYTGPGGARRVLEEPGLDVAVLETARGGILLRGLAYEHNDVGVFTNVSADHLGLHGVLTVEGLARTKATVLRVTRPGGYAVLNADDPLVRGLSGGLHASPFFVSRAADNPAVQAHVETGGHALWADGTAVRFAHAGHTEDLTDLTEVPMTFAGRAGHMVENALCAAAACLALGLAPAEVRAGLASFRNSPDLNTGRLNAYEVDGATVIADYAHNEAGLGHLLDLGRAFVAEGGTLIAIVGTAGDRTDEALRGMGRLAAERADRVIVKDTAKYLRGREAGEMIPLLAEGIEAVEPSPPWQAEGSEVEALRAALGLVKPGDAVAMMCIEQVREVREELAGRGRLIS